MKIGNQTWLAENLNYKTGNSKCYDNNESNGQKYGRLYDWNDAMNACPAGWHLPTDEEWTTLTDAVGGEETAGKMLKSTTGWNEGGNGTDEYGFSALPGGHGSYSVGLRDFSGAGDFGYWWSATETENDADCVWTWFMLGGNGKNVDNVCRYHNIKSVLYSVRCVQDYCGHPIGTNTVKADNPYIPNARESTLDHNDNDFDLSDVEKKSPIATIGLVVLVLVLVGIVIVIFSINGNKKEATEPAQTGTSATNTVTDTRSTKKSAELVPAGYKIAEDGEIKGDLNKDGLDDYVLTIERKQDDSRIGGIVIAFNNGERYKTVIENYSCFSYDFNTSYEISIKKGVLNISRHDGYGNTRIVGRDFKFRHQNSDFELIGYDESENYRTPDDDRWTEATVSINLLSKKMQTKTPSMEQWNEIVINKPIRLRNIADFGEFDPMDYISKK